MRSKASYMLLIMLINIKHFSTPSTSWIIADTEIEILSLIGSLNVFHGIKKIYNSKLNASTAALSRSILPVMIICRQRPPGDYPMSGHVEAFLGSNEIWSWHDYNKPYYTNLQTTPNTTNKSVPDPQYFPKKLILIFLPDVQVTRLRSSSTWRWWAWTR